MAKYRVRTKEGLEIATVEAANLAEALMNTVAFNAPVSAEIVCESGAPVFARREMWLGEYPGWSLIPRKAPP